MNIFSTIQTETDLVNNISEEITECLGYFYETNSIMNQYMTESSTIVHETFITNIVKEIFQKLIDHIKKLCDKFLAIFMNKTDHINYLINKYSDKLKSLTEQDFKNLYYEYKDFRFPNNIPVTGYLNLIEKNIEKLSSMKIGVSEIEEMKYIITNELATFRGKIIGMDKKIPDYQFAQEVKAIFRGADEKFIKPLTKNEFNKILNGVLQYKEVKKVIEADRDKIVKEYEKYMKTIQNALKVEYSNEELNAIIKNNKGKSGQVEIITANMYKEYQTLLLNFITQIAEMYSVVYKEKLNALKDKYNMEIQILRNAIYKVV